LLPRISQRTLIVPAVPLQKYRGEDSHKNWPEPDGANHGVKTAGSVAVSIGVFGAAVGCCAIGQRAVDQNGIGAVDLGDVDNRLVERIVIPVADNIVHIRAVGVLVTAAWVVRIAGANDWLRLVLVGGVVVESVRVGIGVHVCAVEPESGPECNGPNTRTEEQRVNARFRLLARLVGDRRAASVVTSTTIGRAGSASASRLAADV